MANSAHHNFAPVLRFTEQGVCDLAPGQPAEVAIDGTVLTGTAETRLVLAPQPRVLMDATFPLDSVGKPFSFSFESVIDRFCLVGKQIPGFASNFTPDLMGRRLRITWTPNGGIQGLGDNTTKVSRVTFHLFNLPCLLGGRRSVARTSNSQIAIQHIDLGYNDYSIEIRSLIDTDATIKSLRNKGGFGMTHVGVVKRTDGSSFTGEEADRLICALRWFLTFAMGRWCEPACPVGVDEYGDHAWVVWSSPANRSGHSDNWFDEHTVSQLQSFFPKFMGLWVDPSWQIPLRECIYWYVIANDSSAGIDSGLILAQTGLERVAYEYLVNEKQLLTPKNFDDSRASDRLRALFNALRIPIAIPQEATALQAESVSNSWTDAPHALTGVRNALVHPGRKQRRLTRRPLFESWKTALWYLELSILAICGYSGTYGNRLRERMIGQVEYVPWV